MRLAVLGLLAVALAAYTWLGFFSVAPDEQAVVLRLGRYNRTVDPGRYLFHLPWVERYEKRSVTSLIDAEFGFRDEPAPEGVKYAELPDEKRMITTDVNLVNAEFVVRYKIGDLRAYLFSTREPDVAIRDAAAAAVRSVVATFPIDMVLKEGRERIENETLLRLRGILDDYGVGVDVLAVQLQDVEPPQPVQDAFAEVTSAQQEGERLVVEARGYAEKLVPEARGRAEERINQAQAYRESRILRAQGEADRFESVLTEYQKAPDVTRQRLYIETLEELLPRMEKVVMEQGQSEKVLPYLPVLPRRGPP